MTWTLLIVLLGGLGKNPSITQITGYPNEKSCLVAAEAIKRDLPYSTKASCILAPKE